MSRRKYTNTPLPIVLVIGAAVFLSIFFNATQNREVNIVISGWIVLLCLLVFVSFIAFYIFHLKLQKEKLRALRIIDIAAMSGRDFEKYLVFLLSHQGFTAIEATQISGDFGADILAYKDGKKYAIQAKRYTKPVGVTALYECFGGQKYYHCDECIIITNSYFTLTAKELAEKSSTQLIDRDTLARWVYKLQH